MNPDEVGLARTSLDAHTLAVIEQYGVQVLYIFPRADEADTVSPFHYSVGLTAIGSPEVVICGLPQEVGHHVVNEVHRRVRDEGLVLTPGTELEGLLGNGYRLTVCATNEPDTHSIKRFYPDYSVVQLVFQDFSRRYPWDVGYDVDPMVQKDWWVQP